MTGQPLAAPVFRLLSTLERRLALPGDDDSLRARRVTAFLAGVAGAGTAALFAALYFAAGAALLGWLYIVTVVWTAITLAILWARPATYTYCVLTTTVYVTVHPWIVVLASGGYQSGLLPMAWALIGPAGSLLLLGIRPALLNAALYVIMACVAALLDPLVAGTGPVLPQATRLFAGLLSALVPASMVLLISLFLFRQEERARRQADALLLNVLPRAIADQLKHTPATIADGYDEVTVLFADIVGFTRMSAAADPCAVVDLLNAVFSELDDLAGRYGLEKIKTVGDAYMAVGGLPQPRPDHVEAVVSFAVDMLDAVKRHRALNGGAIRLRVGIHTGPTVAGVIGRSKFIYDLWGDTVNTASRMESQGLPDAIQVTPEVLARLAKGPLAGRYRFEPRGPIVVKGKGPMLTYLLRPSEAAPAGEPPPPHP